MAGHSLAVDRRTVIAAGCNPRSTQRPYLPATATVHGEGSALLNPHPERADRFEATRSYHLKHVG